MAEAKTSAKAKNSNKGGWLKGIKSEFSKIIWPDKVSIGKQTTVVVIVTVILGILISIIDNIVQLGLDKIIG